MATPTVHPRHPFVTPGGACPALTSLRGRKAAGDGSTGRSRNAALHEEGPRRDLVFWLLPALAAAQGRTTGQIVGTVKDASGAVVPKADLILIDNGTGATVETRAERRKLRLPEPAAGPVPDHRHVPGLQPGDDSGSRRRDRALDRPRRPVPGRGHDRVGAASRALAGRRDDVDDDRQHRQQRADLEAAVAGRNILNFALLVPGARRAPRPRQQTTACRAAPSTSPSTASTTTRQRFRSGGTSFFTFAPIRLGAIEEVTVSTAGLTADAGAEGAVQVQFVTRRGTNAFRGQVFDQIRTRS